MRIIVLILFIVSGFCQAKAVTPLKSFDRKSYYNVLKSGTADAIDGEIAKVQSSGINGKEAFEGTLLMKKADLMNKPKDKLDLFKKGRIKLETAINSDNANTEYRFMRLIIQEHAPKQAKYKSELVTDADFITKNFKSLSQELQDIIIDYSRQSKTLKTASLQ